MASRNEVARAGELNGEDLDAILDILDSEFLEEELADVYEEACEQMESGKFQCSVCKRVCKTKGGLTRHTNSKHKVDSDDNRDQAEGNGNEKEISNALFITLVNQSCKDLSEDLCFPLDIHSNLANFEFLMQEEEENINDERSQVLGEAKLLYKVLSSKGNVEKFFSKFYANIVPKASNLFYPLSGCTATLLCTKVAEKMIVLSKQSSCAVVLSRKESLSENEKAALQYLGGYVLSNLSKKIFKSKHHKSVVGQQHLSVLQAGRASELESQQRLVDNVNRGGLWKITETVQKIFTLAELEFHSHTTGLTKTSIQERLLKTLCINPSTILGPISNMEQVPASLEIRENSVAQRSTCKPD
eukprot:Seg1619.12 transcript_id=Seg1619.12/GoldUCD/mRNA.D3Y31 product="hypothetical protein" protein_id=Seg1619.12/GoldUCD/D3Y31